MCTTDMIKFIAAKRDGQEHDRRDILAFVGQLTAGTVPDYQAAAWLMATFIRGLTHAETTALTEGLAHSGRTYPKGYFGANSVDKHSTGGVGDKTSLVVVPLCASLGAVVPKMSGRGLGFTGGTLDKLESIAGFRTDLTADRFESIVRNVGCAISAQTDDLVPADGILYSLRDVTATVESIPLIAASVMSKKIALGCPAIVLDVKVGSGAFMGSLEEAIDLAHSMVAIGDGSGLQVACVISNMDEPLGHAIGNALEVQEAVDTLQYQGPPDFTEHCMTVACQMLLAADIVQEPSEGMEHCEQALTNGTALEKFAQMVDAQGGDTQQLLTGRLPRAPVECDVCAPESGYISAINARRIGTAAMNLGAGRKRKNDRIDHSVGITMAVKVGDYVNAGDRVATLHARSSESAQSAVPEVLAAIRVAPDAPQRRPLVYQILRGQSLDATV